MLWLYDGYQIVYWQIQGTHNIRWCLNGTDEPGRVTWRSGGVLGCWLYDYTLDCFSEGVQPKTSVEFQWKIRDVDDNTED